MSAHSRISVLYVDDDTELQTLVSAQLEQETDRLDVRTATSATKGMEFVHGGSVDCVVSDYHMPGQNGVEVLRSVREYDADMPVIMFTETGNETVASESIDAGVTDYIIQQTIGSQASLLAQKIITHTEYRWAQERVARTDRQLRELADTTDDAFWIFSADWTELQFINDAHESIFGDSVERITADPRSFLESVHPDDVERVKEAMKRASSGKPLEIEYRVNKSDALQLWVESRCKPIFDEDGNVESIAGFTREITERKDREQTLIETNEQLETFTSTVAHDLRNPLNVADGNIRLAKSECESAYLDTAGEAVERMDELIGELLALARRGKTIDNRSEIAFEELVEVSSENIVMPDATLEITGSATLSCDPARMREAVENLFRNALEHGGESVTITAGVSNDRDGIYVEEVVGFGLVCPWDRHIGEFRRYLIALGFELPGKDQPTAEVVERFVAGVARTARGEFEEHAVGLPEVHRAEPVAVDLVRRPESLGLDGLAHRPLVLVGRRLERDVVDRAVALPPARNRRQHVDVLADGSTRGEACPLVAGRIALCLFGADLLQPHRPEQVLRRFGVGQPERHRVEAADSGLLGDELRPRNGRVVLRNFDFDQFDRKAVRVAEGEDGLAEPLDSVVVVDVVLVKPFLPVVQAPLGDAECGSGDLPRADLAL